MSSILKHKLSEPRNRLFALRVLVQALKRRHVRIPDLVDRDEPAFDVLGARWHERVSRLLEDDDDSHGMPSTLRDLRPGLRRQLLDLLDAAEAELVRKAGVPRDRLTSNTTRLSRLIGLNRTEESVIEFCARQVLYPPLAELAMSFENLNAIQFFRVLGRVTGCQPSRLQAAVREQSRLSQSGLLQVDEQCFRGAQHSVLANSFDNLELMPGLADKLQLAHFDFDEVFGPFFARRHPGSLSLDQFSYLGDDLSVLDAILRGAVDSRGQGSQVLLYGPPGTGKTELVHALADAMGADLYAVSTGTASGMAYDGVERIRSFRLAQQALRHRRRSLILFDEVEDVFGSHGLSHAGFSSRRHKGWINNLLENCAVPGVWVTNHAGGMDPAYIRRFSLALKLDVPPKSVRLKISRDYLEDLSVAPELLSGIAATEDITPADLDRTRRVLSSLPGWSGDREKASCAALTLLGSGPRGGGRERLRPPVRQPMPAFDPALINTDVDLRDVVDGLQRSGEGRLCLYGPPGTGKTALAGYLADVLERDLITVSASDWLDPYLGMTERHMRQTFEAAAQCSAVLLVDEADSFLQDRDNAGRSWEVTQVNELLKRLEQCRGIVLFATNAFESLDPAVLRRLDMKLAFRPMNAGQNRLMFQRVLECHDIAVDDEAVKAACTRIQSIGSVVGGDYLAAQRRLRVLGRAMTAADLGDAVAAEIRVRARHRGQGMGFTATLN